VVDEEETGSAGKEEASAPVAPQEPSDGGGEDEAHAEDQGQVPPVLPTDDWVGGQVRDVGDSRCAPAFENHPSNV